MNRRADQYAPIELLQLERRIETGLLQLSELSEVSMVTLYGDELTSSCCIYMAVDIALPERAQHYTDRHRST